MLTEVDLEIISGIIKSMLQKQIMSELDISQSTITKRIKRILAELNLRKESDLVDLFLHK